MKKKKTIIISSIVVLLLIVGLVLFLVFKKNKINKNIDEEKIKFAEEYKTTKDNVFTYRTIKEINKILKNGTGLVFLGFPKCPWCRGYVPIINEVAKKEGLEKVYYFNIYEDRKNNTEEYQEMVKLLKGFLRYDDEGNERIYVPSLIAVKNGKILEFDDTRYWNNKKYDSAEEFWQSADLKPMREKLVKMINEVNEKSACTADCD
ncbi:MAG: hypothetical protein SPE00_00265 [Bacilli bacterium]|nr:hypothetical protein [Bacilli bacterium]